MERIRVKVRMKVSKMADTMTDWMGDIDIVSGGLETVMMTTKEMVCHPQTKQVAYKH